MEPGSAAEVTGVEVPGGTLAVELWPSGTEPVLPCTAAVRPRQSGGGGGMSAAFAALTASRRAASSSALSWLRSGKWFPSGGSSSRGAPGFDSSI